MNRGAIKSIIQSAGLLFLAYVVVYFFWESSKLSNWAGTGLIETEFAQVDMEKWVFADVDSSEFSGPFLPSDGDTIVAINDSLTNYEQIAEFLARDHDPETVVKFTYRRFSRDRVAHMTTQSVSVAKAMPFIVLQVLRLLIILSFIGVGLWAFQKRSESVSVRILTLFCYSMAAFPLSMFSVFTSDFASFYIPWQDTISKIMRIFMVFAGGLWLNLHLVFPRQSRLITRMGKWSYLLIYMPQVIIGVWALISRSNVIQDYPRVMVAVMLAQFWLGNVFLNRHHRQARSLLERRQTKLVLRGSAIGITALTFLLVVASFLQGWFTRQSLTFQLAMTNGGFLALLLTPLSLAYAFGRYRLLEVEGKLRRGTRNILITASLLLVFFLAVYFTGQLLITRLGITSRTPILLLAMTLALGVSPAQRWLQEWLERRFYPERYQLRVMIDDLATRMGSFPDRDTLFKHLGERLREALGVERVVAVMKSETGEYSTQVGEVTPFVEASDLLISLGKGGRPVLMDEAMASLRVPFTDGEMMWIRKNEVNLVLPMFARLRLIGFLGLGKPMRGHDYTPEGIDILLSLTNQIALASENLRLLEENLEKRRLEEQLDLAREIQRGFLPSSLPETPGLEVAARSRFCLEVAGDYYDVLALPGGRTMLAVGDVSGKGAGAALIMANLQASLRITATLGLEPKDIASQINNLIYTNTPVEQYITFFLCVYDPVKKKLIYVNAGHNPTLVFDASGRTRELDVGGMILGVMPGALYEQEEIDLHSGERLFLYTDGVTEASSPTGEEFGVVRMKQMLNAIAKRSPEDSLASLEAEVMRFHGRKVLEDDSTLVMAQVL